MPRLLRNLVLILAALCVRAESAQSWRLVTTIPNPISIPSVTFSANEEIVAWGNDNSTISVWDAKQGEEICTLKGHTKLARTIALSPDGITLASGGSDGHLMLWDIRQSERQFTREIRDQFNPRQYYGIRDVAFDGSGRTIYVGMDGTGINSWHAVTGDFHRQWTAAYYFLAPFPYYSVAVRDDAKLLVGGWHNKIRIWSYRDGKMIKRDYAGHEGAVRALALNEDASLLASGGQDGMVLLWDMRTRRRAQTIEAHTRPIWHVSFSGDQSRIITRTRYTVGLFDVLTGKPVEPPRPPRGDQLMAVSPNGHIVISKSADDARHVWWYGDDDALTSAGPDEEHDGSVDTASDGPAVTQVDAVQTASLPTEEGSSYSQSSAVSVVIAAPSRSPVTVTTPLIQLRATAKQTSGDPISWTKVMVNGQLLPGSGKTKTLRVEPSAPRQVIIDSDVPLRLGHNEIVVTAGTVTTESDPATVVVIYAPPQAQPPSPTGPKPNLYVLAVGIAEYANPQFNLRYPDDDARDFVAACEQQEGRFYGQVETRTLTDQQATRVNIIQGLDWLRKSATANDVAFLFASAHGVKDSAGDAYLFGHDADIDSILATAVPWTDFQRVLGRMPGRTMMFMDTCYSGGFASNALTKGVAADFTTTYEQLTQSGLIIWASSTGAEQSVERDEWQNGAFTEALIDGLSGTEADADGDGILNDLELSFYVGRRVRDLTDGAQHFVPFRPAIPDFPLFGVTGP